MRGEIRGDLKILELKVVLELGSEEFEDRF